MLRYYLVPEIGGGAPLNANTPDALRPKYFGDMSGISWGCMPYGREKFRLVTCDLSTFDHNTVTANPDVIALPADIEQALDAAAAISVQTKLEAINIPAQWVAVGMTYRQVLRTVAQIFQFHQRLQGLGAARLLSGGVTLDSTVGSLSVAVRNKLAAASDSFGWDRSTVTASTTLRQLFKMMADQWVGPVHCGGGAI